MRRFFAAVVAPPLVALERDLFFLADESSYFPSSGTLAMAGDADAAAPAAAATAVFEGDEAVGT